MSCSSSEALFEGYLDGTLVPAQRARLLAHLSACGVCQGVLEELRAVDALLATPRAVVLPENFTFATMAEVRTLPRPHVSHAPVFAYLVSYLVAAWLLIGAGFLLAADTMRAFGATALAVTEKVAQSLSSIVGAGTHLVGDFGSVSTFVGSAIVVDVAVVIALIVGFTVVRPRLAGRLRS